MLESVCDVNVWISSFFFLEWVPCCDTKYFQNKIQGFLHIPHDHRDLMCCNIQRAININDSSADLKASNTKHYGIKYTIQQSTTIYSSLTDKAPLCVVPLAGIIMLISSSLPFASLSHIVWECTLWRDYRNQGIEGLWGIWLLSSHIDSSST